MRSLAVAALLIVLSLSAGCAQLRSPAGVYFGTRGACSRPAAFEAAAMLNTTSYDDMDWSPFGRPERGWAIYSLRIQREIRSRCAPQSAGFAAQLARWQADNGLRPSGVLDADAFQAMKTRWQNARPYVALRARGVCPDPPADAALADLRPGDAYPGKTVQMRRKALKALHRMLSAARVDVPSAARGPYRLVAFSGYRSPAYDAERCAIEGNCDGVGRATCSAHRTGLAVDLDLGSAPGFAVDSSADANRLYQTRTPVYRWLVDNARRFGFVNYPFEPWHWEWIGEAP